MNPRKTDKADLEKKLDQWLAGLENQDSVGIIRGILKAGIWFVWFVAYVVTAIFITPFSMFESWWGVLLLLLFSCCICFFLLLVF